MNYTKYVRTKEITIHCIVISLVRTKGCLADLKSAFKGLL